METPDAPLTPRGSRCYIACMTKTTKTTTKQPRDWRCQECGKQMTMQAAERAMCGPNGCPGCGGSDIQLNEGE